MALYQVSYLYLYELPKESEDTFGLSTSLEPLKPSARFLSHFQIWLVLNNYILNKLCGRPPQYAPALCKLTFDLLTFDLESGVRVTCATSVPILGFLGLSVLYLGPMYATDRRQTRMPPALGAEHSNLRYCQNHLFTVRGV